jgi:ankyrin repeat protein
VEDQVLNEKDVCQVIESLKMHAGKNEFSEEGEKKERKEFKLFKKALSKTILSLTYPTEDSQTKEFLEKCKQLQVMLYFWLALSQPKKALMSESQCLEIASDATTIAEVLSRSYSAFFEKNVYFKNRDRNTNQFSFFLELQSDGLAIHFEDQKACSFVKNWLLYFGFKITECEWNKPKNIDCELFLMGPAEAGAYRLSDKVHLYLYEEEAEAEAEAEYVYCINNTTNICGIKKKNLPETFPFQNVVFNQPEDKPLKCTDSNVRNIILGETSRRKHTHPQSFNSEIIPFFIIEHKAVYRFLRLFNPVCPPDSVERLYKQAGRNRDGTLITNPLIDIKDPFLYIFSFLFFEDIFSLAAVNKSMRSFILTQYAFFKGALESYYPGQGLFFSKVKEMTYYGQFHKLYHDECRGILREDRELFFLVKTNRFRVDKRLENPNPECNTLLHVMAQKGQVKFVKYLIEKGAGFNTKNINNDTPLHLAAKNGYIEIVTLLDKKGAKWKENKNRDTPLHLAVKNGQIGVVNYFIQLDYRCSRDNNTDGFSPLALAVLHGHVDIVKAFVETSNIDSVDFQNGLIKGLFPEKVGSVEQQQKRHKVLKYLLENSVIPVYSNGYINRPGKPLSLCVSAVLSNDLPALKLLVQYEFKVDAANEEGETALHVAVRLGRLEIVEFLLEKGANVHCISKYPLRNEKTPFFLAQAGYSKLEKTKANFEKTKANFDVPDDAVDSKSFLAIMKLLKSKGPLVDPNFILREIATGNLSHEELIKLQEYGANITDDLLHAAILSTPSSVGGRENRAAIIFYLIGHTAINIYARHGSEPVTAMHLAIARHDLVTIKWLVDKDGTVLVNSNFPDCEPLLHYAVEKANLDAVQYFVGKNADLTAVNKAGLTPLQLAKRKYYALPLHDPVKKSLRPIIRYLDEASATINAKPQPNNLPSYWNAYGTAVQQSLKTWSSWLSVSNFVGFSALSLFVGIGVAAVDGVSNLLAAITVMTAGVSLAIGALAFIPFAAWKIYEHYNEWRFEQREDACRSWVEQDGKWRKHTQHGNVLAQDLKNRYEILSHDVYLEELKKGFDDRKYSYRSYLKDLRFQLFEWAIKNPWLFLFTILSISLSIFIGADFIHSGLTGVFGNFLTTICHYLGPLLTQSMGGLITPGITHILGAVLLAISPLIILDVVTRATLTHQNNKIVAQALSTLPDLQDIPESSFEIYSPDLSARAAAAQFWFPASEEAHRTLVVPVIVTAKNG